MFLDKYQHRIKKYKAYSKNKINQSQKTTIYSLIIIFIIGLIITITYIFFKNPLWFRLLKIKLNA
jgi:uncharacterized membrane protein affecting hemolysin expression